MALVHRPRVILTFCTVSVKITEQLIILHTTVCLFACEVKQPSRPFLGGQLNNYVPKQRIGQLTGLFRGRPPCGSPRSTAAGQQGTPSCLLPGPLFGALGAAKSVGSTLRACLHGACASALSDPGLRYASRVRVGAELKVLDADAQGSVRQTSLPVSAVVSAVWIYSTTNARQAS